MVSYNYTYNYNQKQPSFWQSLGMGMLYQGMGAFGSLTGCGMGMGGFGMGMGSCMGMGGSLFNMGGFGMGSYGMGMYGMGGYGMGCCGMSDGAFGAQLGLMGVGMIMKGVTSKIADRKADKAATVTKESLNEKASANLKILSEVSANKITSLDDFKPSMTASQYNYTSFDNKVSTALSEYTKAQSDTAEAKAKLEKLGGEKGPSSTDAKYKKTEKKEDGTEVVTYDNQQFEIDYKEWYLKKNEVARLSTAESKKKEALTKAENDRNNQESKVETAIEALKKLKEQYDEVVTEENNKAAKQKEIQQAKEAEKAQKAKEKENKKAFTDAWDEFKRNPNSTNKNKVDIALSNINNADLKSKYQKTLNDNPDYKKLS